MTNSCKLLFYFVQFSHSSLENAYGRFKFSLKAINRAMEKIALVRDEDKFALVDDAHLFCGIILTLELTKGEFFAIVWHEA